MTDTSATESILERFAELTTSDDYEAVRNALSEVIRMLEQPGLGLNQSVRAYEVGRQLSNRCQSLLDAAELRVSVLDGTEISMAPGSGTGN